MTPAVLEATGLKKRFRAVTAVDGVDLCVRAGGTTAVVGASGCGKTTLLRLIAGFETLDDGSLSVSGKVVADGRTFVPPHRREVGYVAQDGALFPHLTVGQNIAYGLRRGMRSAEGRRRVEHLLQTVSLDPAYLSRRPDQLSGGQQQRVALARALARSPALMLLDEPFSALDTGLRVATRRAVASVLADAEVTTLLVTHDQEEALSIADQIAVMRDGRFTQVGTPREVYAAPADPFTARFLGDSVFLPAEVDGSTATCALGRIPVRPTTAMGGASVMLRPEQLVVKELSDSERNSGVGTVLAVEFLGSGVLLTIDLGGDVAPIVVRQTSASPPGVHAKVEINVVGAAVAYPESADA